MLAIHKPKTQPMKYCLFNDKQNYNGKMIELPNGYEFHSFIKEDSVIKGYVNAREFIIISVWDTCWIGNIPIPREIIPEMIEIFTGFNR